MVPWLFTLLSSTNERRRSNLVHLALYITNGTKSRGVHAQKYNGRGSGSGDLTDSTGWGESAARNSSCQQRAAHRLPEPGERGYHDHGSASHLLFAQGDIQEADGAWPRRLCHDHGNVREIGGEKQKARTMQGKQPLSVGQTSARFEVLRGCSVRRKDSAGAVVFAKLSSWEAFRIVIFSLTPVLRYLAVGL